MTTNYLTSVGVQHFTVAIASGSATGTATITAVGSGAFILWGGNKASGSNAQDIFAYLALTNSTTITATRGNAGSNTVTVSGCIVDADTTNLIKTVQYGTVTVSNGSASGTASISAVTNNNAAVHYLGTSDSNANATSQQNDYPRLSLSGTTVTATRINVTGTLTVGFVVIEFQGSALNQAIQNVSATTASSVTSFTATITSVDVNNTFLLFAGSTITGVSTNLSQAKQYGFLTNGTTITVNVNTATSSTKTYNCSVVELVAGILTQNAQRGTTSMTSANSATSTITSSVKARSAITWLGNITTSGSYSGSIVENEAVLTNATTVTVSRSGAGSTTSTGSWEVAEFPAFVGAAGNYIYIGGFL